MIQATLCRSRQLYVSIKATLYAEATLYASGNFVEVKATFGAEYFVYEFRQLCE